MNEFCIDFESELNPDQLAAVMSPPDRPALVLAGAGSGKTRTLTYRVAWLIAECGLSPKEILLLTFTNKAANQMLNRIKDLTGHPPHTFWGGTFHSIGNKFLRIEGSAIGLSPNFTILDAEDAEKLLKTAVGEIYPNFFSNKDNPKTKLLFEIISYARNTCSSIQEAMMKRFSWINTPSSQIEEIAEFYAEKKHTANLCDFDDLLELWLKLLEENPDILHKYSSRFKNILVDEYQDTNLLQSKILDLLAQTGRISAVGDDAQCIYSWRGAEIDNIRKFRDRYPAAFIYKIERNYRSTPQILEFANGVLEDMDTSEDYRKILVPARIGNEKPVVMRCMDGISQARRVADAISSIVATDRFKYSDIAILYRSHFQAMDMQLQLQHRGIPFAITSGLKFFEQAHVKDIIAQIKFIENPQDSVAFMRFIRFLPKVGEKTAMKIFWRIHETAKKREITIPEALVHKDVLSKIPSSAKSVYESLSSELGQIGKMLESMRTKKRTPDKNFAEQAKANESAQIDFFDAFDDLPKPDNTIQTTTHIETPEVDASPKGLIKLACTGWYKSAMKTLYEDWEERCLDFDSLFEYASRYDNIEDFLANVTLEISEAETGQADNSTDRIRLMTIHQAKGLEFPVVFIISAADGLFPTKRSLDDGDIEEERRLFYVAATRAMDFLVIAYPRVSVTNGNYEMREPSRFLQAIPLDLYNDGV